MACSPAGRILASGSRDGEIKLWEMAAGKERATLDGHDSSVQALAFSPDGKTLASGSLNGQLKLWDSVTGHEKRCIAGKLGPVKALAYTPDGKVLAVGGYVREWDERSTVGRQKGPARAAGRNQRRTLALIPRPEMCRHLPGHFRRRHHAWRRRATIRRVCIYDLRAKKEIAVLKGHAVFLNSVAMTLDGKLFASADWNGTIRLWDAGSAKLLARFVGHKCWINSVAFTPDGKKLISGGGEGLVKFWDVAEVMGRMEGVPDP